MEYRDEINATLIHTIRTQNAEDVANTLIHTLELAEKHCHTAPSNTGRQDRRGGVRDVLAALGVPENTLRQFRKEVLGLPLTKGNNSQTKDTKTKDTKTVQVNPKPKPKRRSKKVAQATAN